MINNIQKTIDVSDGKVINHKKITKKELLEEVITNKKISSLDEKMLFNIIPELKDMVGFEHKHPHHCYDVWEHTKVAIEKSEPDLEIRLALLLHDIGKPHSYQEGEVRHFKGHSEKSAEMSKKILTRVGYTEKQIEDICYLVANHDTIIDINKVDSRNIEIVERLLKIQYCDAYAHAPEHIEKRIKILDEIRDKLEEKEKNISINYNSQFEKSSINGEKEK